MFKIVQMKLKTEISIRVTYETMTQMLQIFVNEKLEKQLLFMGMLQGSKSKFPIKWTSEAIEFSISAF